MQRTLQGTLSKNCSSVGKMSSADFLFLLLYIAALGEGGGGVRRGEKERSGLMAKILLVVQTYTRKSSVKKFSSKLSQVSQSLMLVLLHYLPQ